MMGENEKLENTWNYFKSYEYWFKVDVAELPKINPFWIEIYVKGSIVKITSSQGVLTKRNQIGIIQFNDGNLSLFWLLWENEIW